MAQIIQNKFPNDLDTRKIIGFQFPLNGRAVFNPTYQTRDQIKANLVNYLLTNKNERVFNPTFGANLRSLLFENLEDYTLETLKTLIQSDINRFFPFVRIQRIEFIKSLDINTLNFILDYEILNFGINDQLNILLQ